MRFLELPKLKTEGKLVSFGNTEDTIEFVKKSVLRSSRISTRLKQRILDGFKLLEQELEDTKRDLSSWKHVPIKEGRL